MIDTQMDSGSQISFSTIRLRASSLFQGRGGGENRVGVCLGPSLEPG